MAGRFKIRRQVWGRGRSVTPVWFVYGPDGREVTFFFRWHEAIYCANKFARRRKVHAENRALWPV
jgi:hypothetical protein